MDHLRALAQLKDLNLSRTQITDAGLERLGAFKQLRYLDLTETAISDVGVECLKGLTELETVLLQDTKVTAAGEKRLLKALPKCRDAQTEGNEKTEGEPALNRRGCP